MIGGRHQGWPRHRLGYCANVHPGTTLAQLQRVIRYHFTAVRSLRELPAMSAGLWLGSSVAREIQADERERRAFGELLEAHGVELITLNGFPFSDFHQAVVKAGVYTPDWATGERYRYTLDLAGILSSALPEGETHGTISTLPLGYRAGWTPEREEQALANLCRIAADLHRLEEERGRSIRICLEMEPGCVLERTGQMVELFTRKLPGSAEHLGIPREHLFQHLGACYDVCHQAVMFEEPSESLQRLAEAGITVGKIQISSALELPGGSGRDPRELLTDFVEPRYLHQVRIQDRDGQILAAEDLPEALADPDLLDAGTWRVHFHVPVHARSLQEGTLNTTRSTILSLLDHLRDQPDLHPHLEVETYTWQVLPAESRPTNDDQLHAGLAAELAWLESEMAARGLIADGQP